MRNLFLSIAIVTIFFACNSEKSKNETENVVIKYIEYANSGNTIGVDSLLSKDFKFYSDTNIIDRSTFLSNVKIKPNMINVKRQILEIENLKNIIKTKEEIINDYTTNLNIKPGYRKREYHVNENKINSIYNIETFEPENYKLTINNFYSWAKENYRTVYDKIIELDKKGENYETELNFLFAKIKNEGLEVLNKNKKIGHNKIGKKVKSKEVQINKKVKSISTKMFTQSVIGKTKSEIKHMYGKPCEVQKLSVFIFWYYGKLHCGKNRTIIYNEDSEKELMQVQIQFSGNRASAVNFM